MIYTDPSKMSKSQYRTMLLSHPSHMGLHRQCQSLQGIAGYKVKACKIAGSNGPLSNKLNVFSARVEHEVSGSMPSTPEASDEAVSEVTIADVRTAYSKVNPWKATGPDGVLKQAFTPCEDQLVGVFTVIFKLSLQQSEFPICFKKTTIIPVAKIKQAACLNDDRPVALTSIEVARVESFKSFRCPGH